MFPIQVSAAAPAIPTAESAATSAQPTASPEAIDALIEDLKDPERRETLIRELEALQAARAEAGGDAQTLQNLNLNELLGRALGQLEQTWNDLLAVDALWVAQQALWSVAALMLVAIVYWIARRGLRRLESRFDDGAHPGAHHRGFLLGQRLVKITLLLLAGAMLLQIWGASLVDWLAAVTALDWVRSAVAVLIIGIAALMLWSLSDSIIEGTLRAQSRRLDNARKRSRLLTVTPLLQGTVRITIGVLALLLILAQLGLNIGPLLAGAGIIGLAVGFGAQSLIKDLLIGVTLLLEDAASVGDVIDVGGRIGEVEAMGIRMLRLRDLDGTVHLVPYSEIATISNLTKDFAYVLLDVRVAYRENVDQVIDALIAVAQDLRDDQDFGPVILEDLEVMGVNALGEAGVDVRIRLKTLPLERWHVGREFRRRIKARFDEDGIEIPYPHRVIRFGVDKSGDAPPLRLATAGAGGATGRSDAAEDGDAPAGD
tara:strand:- start:2372 stop:3826 length:1455 start_codon:yes stop_codon:yes gene_type:complete